MTTYTVILRGLGLNAEGLLNRRPVIVEATSTREAWSLGAAQLQYGEYVTEVWPAVTQTSQFMGR